MLSLSEYATVLEIEMRLAQEAAATVKGGAAKLRAENAALKAEVVFWKACMDANRQYYEEQLRRAAQKPTPFWRRLL